MGGQAIISYCLSGSNTLPSQVKVQKIPQVRFEALEKKSSFPLARLLAMQGCLVRVREVHTYLIIISPISKNLVMLHTQRSRLREHELQGQVALLMLTTDTYQQTHAPRRHVV